MTLHHTWRRYPAREQEGWENSACNIPNCDLPRNGAGQHIRCIRCHDYPPLAPSTEDSYADGLWFQFVDTIPATHVGGPCPNLYCGLMEQVRDAENNVS